MLCDVVSVATAPVRDVGVVVASVATADVLAIATD